MPLSKKIETFVLKQHYDESNGEIKDDVREIKADIKTILTLLPNKQNK